LPKSNLENFALRLKPQSREDLRTASSIVLIEPRSHREADVALGVSELPRTFGAAQRIKHGHWSLSRRHVRPRLLRRSSSSSSDPWWARETPGNALGFDATAFRGAEAIFKSLPWRSRRRPARQGAFLHRLTGVRTVIRRRLKNGTNRPEGSFEPQRNFAAFLQRSLREPREPVQLILQKLAALLPH
jgi:hypothetical protein